MVVFDEHFADIVYDKEKSLAQINWKGKCSSEEYRGAFEKMLEMQNTNKIIRYLSDVRKQSVISPEDRKWFETVAMPKAIEQGLKAAAVVFDGNVFKKYYLNVILSATNKFGLPLKLFNEVDEAVSWLMSKS